MFSATEIFDIAVQIERNGEKFYRQAATTTEDPDLRQLLVWLADAETEHGETFLEIKDTLSNRDEDHWLKEMNRTLLQNAVENHALSLDDIDFRSLPDREALIRVALELEEDSISFYEILGSFVEDSETLQHLQQIIVEERKHISLLKNKQLSFQPVTVGADDS